MSAFVDVAVGLPVPGTYCYAVPRDLGRPAQLGMRVLVPFGPRGVTGVVVREDAQAPADVDIRPVHDILDDQPSLDPKLIDLCLWVADYYEAPPGEVLRAALPAGTSVAARKSLRLSAVGRAVLAGGDSAALSNAGRRLLLALAAGRPVRKVPSAEAELVAARLVEVAHERKAPRVAPRTAPTVRLTRGLTEEERRALDRAPKRAAVITALEAGELEVRALEACVPGAAAVVRALIRTGLCERGRRELASRPVPRSSAKEAAPAPTEAQARALVRLHGAIDQGDFCAFLLHGVTGSGKTEVYLQAIFRVLHSGRSAIVLVPEIALTPQLAARFRARFGDLVAVLHSGLADRERLAEWRRLRRGEARIALGARSAVFAPVAELGIVVVDEEHDPSFKQEEGIRYQARDVALVRAQRAGAVCVLGSATPSLESYAHAQDGRYELLELPARATARPLPEVEVVDLRRFRADGEAMLTAPLAQAIDATLCAGEQAILFLNRRGFATFVVCGGCGHACRCPQCSVSLTYHRAGERLKCHYCGHSEHVPIACPACQAEGAIRRLGLGTERVEAALRSRYPQARIGRLDRDTSTGRGLQEVLTRVSRRELDILVGTQMVTKGHDFPGVTLVGVLCADTGLSLPDFRAAERTFQLLTQVAGRAGRGDRPGRVIIQTYAPDHPAVVCAARHDYARFYAAESAVRTELQYPPTGRLVAIRLDGPDEAEVRAIADDLGARTRALAHTATGVVVMGPAPAPLQRLKGRSRWHIWVKSSDRQALRMFVRRSVKGLDHPRSVAVTVDVDPVSTL